MASSVLIMAGEVSGDNLGSAILQALHKEKNVKNTHFWGCGGERMQEEGVEILHGIDELATIGFWEILTKYRHLKKLAHHLVEEAVKRKIRQAILIDFPGFNLYLARHLKENGIETYLIVSPQIWAWNYKRIHKIRKYIDTVFCLYKFEVDIYEKENVHAIFMGHPAAYKAEKNKKNLAEQKTELRKKYRNNKIVALLPGSRKSEITRHLPFLLDTARRYKDKHPDSIFLLPTPNQVIHQLVLQYEIPDFIQVHAQNADLVMMSSDAAIACSGTVTLECALYDLPFVLIYKTSLLTYYLARMLIRGDYIGLVNIIAASEVTREFIQKDMQIEPVVAELDRLLFDTNYYKEMKKKFVSVRENLGNGDAASMAARVLLEKIIRQGLA